MCCELRSQLGAADQRCLAAVREAEERGRADARGAISTFSRIHSSLSKGVRIVVVPHQSKVSVPDYHFISLVPSLLPSFVLCATKSLVGAWE